MTGGNYVVQLFSNKGLNLSANIALVNESVVWATRWHNIEWVSPSPGGGNITWVQPSQPGPYNGKCVLGINTTGPLLTLMGTNIRNEGNGITHTMSEIIWWRDGLGQPQSDPVSQLVSQVLLITGQWWHQWEPAQPDNCESGRCNIRNNLWVRSHHHLILYLRFHVFKNK